MANRTVANLTAVLQMNNTKFKKGVQGSQKTLKGFSKQVDKIGGMLAGAFAVSSIVNFGKEVVSLTAKAEGVEAAFRNLGSPGLLVNLQKATRGTVDNLQLMQAAVKAKNFKIPLEQLATYFEFATNRAIQTGESVDYLVDSIINGIGRKSALVLDNLGISAAELQAEMKLVGDFGQAAGNIIERSMQDAGDVASTLATSLAQISTAWTNFKLTIGNNDAITWFLRGVKAGIEDINKLLNRGTNTQAIGEMMSYVSTLKDKTPEQQQAALNKKLEEQRQKFMELVDARKEQQKLIDGSGEETRFRRQQIKFAETEIEKIDEKQNYLLDTIRLYEEQLVAAKAVNEVETDPKTFDQWAKENDLIRERIKLQGDLTSSLLESQQAAIKGIVSKPNDKYKSTMGGYLYDNDEEWTGGDEAWEALADNAGGALDGIGAQADKLGNQIGMSLVSQFDSLGVAIGQFASGAEDSFKSLGDAIMQNLGNILIMMGAQTGNIPLLLAGAGLQLGGGFLRGFGSNATSQKSSVYSGGNVNFQISGQNLVGVMERQNNKTSRFT